MKKQKSILNRAMNYQKKIFTLCLTIVSLQLFSQDWVGFSDLREKEEGFVVENSGYTTKGIIQIKPCSEKIIINTKDSTIKIDPLLIKLIQKGTHTIIPKFFNDSTDFYFCEAVDTVHTLKIYKGYYCGNSHTTGVIGFMGSAYGYSPVFWRSYVLSTDNKEAVSLDNTDNGINMVSYKKQLRKIFANNQKILQYLDSYKKIKFEDIPKMVDYINSLY